MFRVLCNRRKTCSSSVLCGRHTVGTMRVPDVGLRIFRLQKDMLEDAKRTSAYYNAVMNNRAQFADKVPRPREHPT